jgi:hypothetical protein
MGFPHDKTTHHFRLYASGGAIEVTANDANDVGNIQAIRSHLKHISLRCSLKATSRLQRSSMTRCHPAVSVMKEKRSEISYSFEEIAAGGKVQINTADPESLKAIHEFLRFQIADHHTGDSPDIASQ